MNYTVYRGSWRRGGDRFNEEYGDTSLLNHKNMMCCLGQCAAQLNIPLADIRDEGEPNGITDRYLENLVDGCLFTAEDDGRTRQSRFSDQAILINDDASISDAEREQRLIRLAESYAFKITFVDGIAPWFQTEAS